MKHALPALPYDLGALSPTLSAETMTFHYGKHFQAYVDNLNRLIAGTLYEDMELDEIVIKASGTVFNNAAQAWNHAFYFAALTPTTKPIPSELAYRLTTSFGSVQAFKEKLLGMATSLFGAGWTWLVGRGDGTLDLVNTTNAGNPLTDALCPLLTVDVWEHAYYIDYRNHRADYLKALWEIIDWDVVEKRLTSDECNVYI